MFTDIVGHTSLVERDEAAAITARERHRARLATLAAQFEAELIEVPGDALIPLESSRALAALVPGAVFQVVEGGHRQSFGATAEVRAVILEFLAEDG